MKLVKGHQNIATTVWNSLHDKLDFIGTIEWCLADVSYGQWALECSIYSTIVQHNSASVVLLHIVIEMRGLRCITELG